MIPQIIHGYQPVALHNHVCAESAEHSGESQPPLNSSQ
jgi:hypothetical protein